jgi:hypothetical protein
MEIPMGQILPARFDLQLADDVFAALADDQLVFMDLRTEKYLSLSRLDTQILLQPNHSLAQQRRSSALRSILVEKGLRLSAAGRTNTLSPDSKRLQSTPKTRRRHLSNDALFAAIVWAKELHSYYSIRTRPLSSLLYNRESPNSSSSLATAADSIGVFAATIRNILAISKTTRLMSRHERNPLSSHALLWLCSPHYFRCQNRALSGPLLG